MFADTGTEMFPVKIDIAQLEKQEFHFHTANGGVMGLNWEG